MDTFPTKSHTVVPTVSNGLYRIKLYKSDKHDKLRCDSGLLMLYTKGDMSTCSPFCDIKSECYADAWYGAARSWVKQGSYPWHVFLTEIAKYRNAKLRLSESGEIPYLTDYTIDYAALSSLGKILVANNIRCWTYTHLQASRKNAAIAIRLEREYGIVIRFSVTNAKALSLALKNGVKYSPIVAVADNTTCICEKPCVHCSKCLEAPCVSFVPHGSKAKKLIEHITKYC